VRVEEDVSQSSPQTTEDAAPVEPPPPPAATVEDIELVPKYDPTKSQSQTSIDPYESIDKDTVAKKDAKVSSLMIENSASGSGNSENSDNSIYAKVKKVPKKDEIAYAVVDMKESQEKYEMVNGGIVRRQTQDGGSSESLTDVVNADKLSVQEEEHQGDLEEVEKEEENSAGSGFYASVKPSSTETKEKEEDKSEDNQVIDAYAVVIKADSAVESSIAPEEREDSGASGFYAKVDNTTHSNLQQLPSPSPPPLPPPHPLNMPKIGVGGDKTDIDSSYEPISSPNTDHEIERSNMYDSISEMKMDAKMKRRSSKDLIEVKTTKQRHDTTTNKHNKHHHHKSQKKDDAAMQEKNLPSKSPKSTSSRFSRVNPFKSSKKQKHRQSNEAIDDMERDDSHHHHHIEETLSNADKIASLPLSARRSPRDALKAAELNKRHSVPHIPPPLPSVDKLIHLTEHQKSRRGSSLDAYSSPGLFFLYFLYTFREEILGG